ncbi:hypothetical protein [Bradyrhizobium murdochi]|uniref:hypothetical protein n=1 Tax=Bradyrhizobium murdochi TaxID=1038859 RepID=UPI0004297C10|nr:hypothetical protein [Bradyrhizobium murdochi]
MSAKTIEARAVISAKDSTGSTLDKIAAKFRGVEKNARALEGIRPLKFTGGLDEELRRLKLTERELQSVRKAQAALQSQLLADPVGRRPSMYFRALDDWKNKTVSHWREIKASVDDTDKAHRKFFAHAGAAALRWGMVAGGIGSSAYAASRAARFTFDKTQEASRETTKQRQSGLTQAQSDAIAAEAERQSQLYPSISQTEFRSAGREATMQLGSSEAGLKMMSTIGKFMTSGKVLWGSDRIDEQTRKALQILDARQITDPERASSLLDALVRSSQVEGGPDLKAEDLRTSLRYGRDMLRGQSDRFITSVLPQLGVDMGYPQAGTGLASMHSALIGGRQKEAATEFQRAVGLRNDSGLVGQSLFARDVDKWFDEHFIPAMKKAKVNTEDPAEVAAFNSKFFSNRTAADVAGNMVSGQAQRIRRREQQERATGIAGAESLHTRDVGVALEAASTQLTNLASSAKLADASIAGLNSAMGLLQQLNESTKDGLVRDLADRAKKTFDTDMREIRMIGGAIGKLVEWDRANAKNFPSVVPEWLGGPKAPTYSPGEDPMGSDYQRRQFRSKEFWEGLGREGASAASAARLRREADIQSASPFAVPSLSKTMTYGTGINGNDDKTVSVQGDVHGEAALSIKIEAPELIKAYYDAQRAISLAGQLTSNGVGSTGKSSPDAAAPATPAQPTAP